MRLSRFGVSEISTAATKRKEKRVSLSTFCLVTVSRLSVRKQSVLSVTFTCMRHTNGIPMNTMSGQSTCTISVVPTGCHGNKCMSLSLLLLAARTRTLLCPSTVPAPPHPARGHFFTCQQQPAQSHSATTLPPSLAHQSAKLQLCSARQGSTCAQ